MSNLINFNFENSPIRVVEKQGEPWFVANDICGVLGLTNPRQALTAIDDDEKGVILTDTLGGEQKINIINESGLYILILRSRKATEKGTVQHKFRKWVTSEVLPSIRKTGSYTVAPVYPAVNVINAPAPSHGELYKTFIATVNLQGVMTMREMGKNEFISTYDDLPNLLRYRSWGVSDEKMAKIAKAALNKITGEWD